ncbi:tRNA-intron lyase [Nanoarchaeota archaeon]
MVKEAIKAVFTKGRVLTENSDGARELYNQSRFGKILENGRVQLSLLESLYLLSKAKIQVLDGRNKVVEFDSLLKKAQKQEHNLWTRYCVFKDMRDRGYIVKTALKFGADFRVYDRGVKPGEDHARWVVYPVQENTSLTWHDFSAKNRVAHSTKKRLLVGVVDEENDCTYWEIKWMRP